MPGVEYNNLFSETGPRNMLEYLQSRLVARDLSADEALAMLSAVHEELNDPANMDRGVYQKYSEFMETLRTEMPDVHAYVVSAWERRGENREKAHEEVERTDDDVEGDELSGPQDSESVKESKSGASAEGIALAEGDDDEGGEVGDEPEEDVLESAETDRSEFEESKMEELDRTEEPDEDSDKEEGKEDEQETENEAEDKNETSEEDEDDSEVEEKDKDDEETEGEEADEGDQKSVEDDSEDSDEESEEGGDGEDSGEVSEEETTETSGESEENESGEAAEAVEDSESESAVEKESNEMGEDETEPLEEDEGGDAAVD